MLDVFLLRNFLDRHPGRRLCLRLRFRVRHPLVHIHSDHPFTPEAAAPCV